MCTAVLTFLLLNVGLLESQIQSLPWVYTFSVDFQRAVTVCTPCGGKTWYHDGRASAGGLDKSFYVSFVGHTPPASQQES